MEAKLTGIDRSEALRYLGFRGGALGPDAEAELALCEALVLRTARPRALWRRFRLLLDGSLEGAAFRPAGEDIRAHLSGCREAVLMAATLGAEIDVLIRRTQVTEPGRALLLDACASAAIENVCDHFCADLARELAPLYLTERFSPGYGDFPLESQQDFFRLLDMQRRLGVSLTPGNFMLPQKSVTALLGLADTPRPRRPGSCALCERFETCAFRKEGGHCGKG